MASAAVVGSVLLALIEGMGIWMNNYFAQQPMMMEDPNAMGGTITGPPENDITAPPTSGGVGMLPTGLTLRRAPSTSQQTQTIGGGEGESERFDSGGYETTFSSGGGGGGSGGGEKSGGWWPFGSSS